MGANVWRDFIHPRSALSRVAGRNCTGKFTATIDFPMGIYVTIADADIESVKSLPTLFKTYLDHMLVKFEQFV